MLKVKKITATVKQGLVAMTREDDARFFASFIIAILAMLLTALLTVMQYDIAIIAQLIAIFYCFISICQAAPDNRNWKNFLK